MGWEEDIRSFLLSHSTIVARIDNRLYVDEFPQEVVVPAIVYGEFGESEDELLDATSSGLKGTLVQFNAWARTVIEARDARQAVIDAMLPLGVYPVGSPPINIGVLRGANKVGVSGNKEPITQYFRRGVDFRIWHA